MESPGGGNVAFLLLTPQRPLKSMILSSHRGEGHLLSLEMAAPVAGLEVLLFDTMGLGR
jgi:hypothetical protein